MRVVGRRNGRLTGAFLEKVVSELGLEARFGVRVVFESWFCHLLAVRLWGNHVTSLHVNFVVLTMQITL